HRALACAVERSARSAGQAHPIAAGDRLHPCDPRRTMTNLILATKLIHVLGATVLFGTGLGIAFFMWMAHRSRDPAAIAHTARTVVIADAFFTASAVIVQPFSGGLLAWSMGYPLAESWIVASLVLYGLVGCCWLPVVGIQLRLRNIAEDAARRHVALPP